MATMNVQGLDIFQTQLNNLVSKADSINRGALGDGASLVADEVKKALNEMPTCSEGRPKKGEQKTGATENEKSQIVDNFGISKFRSDNGSVNTSIGFTGYVETYSVRFNNNIPTGMLMQAIEYGTTERRATHTVTNAVKSITNKVTQTIQSSIDERVNNIMNQ